MAFTSFLALFAVAASAIVFLITRKRVGFPAASGLAALTFLGIAVVSIAFIQVALSGMNG